MGRVIGNILTKGFSGKIGDEIVFRQVKGRTFMGKRPAKHSTKTFAQAQQQGTFKKAVYYARTLLLDATARAYYTNIAKATGMRSAYNAAIKDYMTTPQIAAIYTDNYKGVPGNPIYIEANQNLKIKSLTVTITTATNVLIESGEAVPDQGQWMYITQQPNAVIAGTTISVTAKDRPGKIATLHKVL